MAPMPQKLSEELFVALLRLYTASPRCLLTQCRLARPAYRLYSTSATRWDGGSSSGLTVQSISRRFSQRTVHRQRAIGASIARRSYATTRSPNRNDATGAAPSNIAVLGGGLSGLTTAYYLTRYLPDAHVTVYEAGDRLGGWVHTEKVEVETGEPGGTVASVQFERGPRTVLAQGSRPLYDDLVLYELISCLGLQNEVRATDRFSPGPLQRRYVYYPDHLVDVTGPTINRNSLGWTLGSFMRVAQNMLTEPAFTGVFSSGLHYYRTAWKRHQEKLARQRPVLGLGQGAATPPRVEVPADVDGDVSIGDYFAERVGQRDLIDNMLSALIHGIYGGDVWKLSMRSSMFSPIWMRDRLPPTMDSRDTWIHEEDFALMQDVLGANPFGGDLLYKLAAASRRWGYIDFRRGFGTLTDALAGALKDNPQVTVKTGAKVVGVKLNKDASRIEVATNKSGGQPAYYDKVISSLLSKNLAGITGGALPSLRDTHAVTIQVVNLWYPQPNLHAPYSGFGYLIPQTVSTQQNPEAALGVLFDSDREAAAAAADAARHRGGGASRDSFPGTKLTVMMGGHYFDGVPDELLPSDDEAIARATSLVQRHLGIPADIPVAALAKTARGCIPQHYVGHSRRLAAAASELSSAFRGRLAVVGGSYHSPGVLPSMRYARDAAMTAAGRKYGSPSSPSSSSSSTAVAAAALGGGDVMLLQPKEILPLRFGNGLLDLVR